MAVTMNRPPIMVLSTKNDLLAFILKTQNVGLKGSQGILEVVGKINDDSGKTIAVLKLILQYVSPIAFAMLMIYFAIGIIEDVQQKGGEIDLKSFVKAGIGLLVGCVFIQAAPHIIGRLIALNDALVTSGNGLANLEKTANDIDTDMSSYNIITLWFLAISSILSLIPQVLAMVVLGVTIFSAKIEVVLRLGFAPLGFSGFASDSGKHNAIRYFRKLVASMIYMFGISAVLAVAYTLNLADMNLIETTGDETNFLIKWLLEFEKSMMALAVPFAAIGAVSAMKGIVNEALGA